jgi:hypothetical protein
MSVWNYPCPLDPDDPTQDAACREILCNNCPNPICCKKEPIGDAIPYGGYGNNSIDPGFEPDLGFYGPTEYALKLRLPTWDEVVLGFRCSCPCGVIACKHARRLGIDADRFAPNADPSFSGMKCVDDPCDAFRHCYWTCKMAQDSWISGNLLTLWRRGFDCAKFIGDLYEEVHSTNSNSEKMDKHNNAVGRIIGRAGWDCHHGCLMALQIGWLQKFP